MDNYAFEMRHIVKKFGNFAANNDISFCVRRGEIHALAGENGAGKSTLMSVLFGLYEADQGQILINGEIAHIKDPNDANRFRIGMVHQHFKLIPNFTALENIVLGVEPTRHGFLNLKSSVDKLKALIEKYNFAIDLNKQVKDMTVGMQQRVEILKMLYRDNDILIFDEPTAVLTPQEIDELMDIMIGLKAEGKTIVFISHKLAEVMKVSDRCTVLWKGTLVGTVDISNTTKEHISEMMVGRKVQLVPDKAPLHVGNTILEVCGLSAQKGHKEAVKSISFQVNRGEIVCIAGIDGNGQMELAEAITGLLPIKSGTLLFENEQWQKKSIRYRNTHGMAYVPEDRHKHGLVLDYNVEENMVLKSYFEDRFQKHGIIQFKEIRKHANELIKKYDIRVGDSGPETIVRSMSGGNQQKIILAREISSDPKLIVAVQPTRGLDVGAIECIHKYLIEMRDHGSAVLLISLEMDEVMALSDRILVMFDGEIVCNLAAKDTTPQQLGLYMAGAKREEQL